MLEKLAHTLSNRKEEFKNEVRNKRAQSYDQLQMTIKGVVKKHFEKFCVSQKDIEVVKQCLNKTKIINPSSQLDEFCRKVSELKLEELTKQNQEIRDVIAKILKQEIALQVDNCVVLETETKAKGLGDLFGDGNEDKSSSDAVISGTTNINAISLYEQLNSLKLINNTFVQDVLVDLLKKHTKVGTESSLPESNYSIPNDEIEKIIKEITDCLCGDSYLNIDEHLQYLTEELKELRLIESKTHILDIRDINKVFEEFIAPFKFPSDRRQNNV
ncbi:MAG: hypothetical protein LBU04_06855, partial [Christensenellaceae bacterium]|nr:hypothetical protein [Christensenellaceae bacterium]